MRGLVWFLLIALVGGACGDPEETPPDAGYEERRDILVVPDLWDPGERPPGSCGYGYGEECPQGEVDCLTSPCIHGLCVDGEASGADFCQCDEGYFGQLCDSCAPGYMADGLECVLAGECADSPCVYGTCRIDGDSFACDCNEGYSGALCDQCAEGYHPEDLECVAD